MKNTDLVFATFHVDVGETPFFIGIDHDKAVIIISIRGTLSMKVEILRILFTVWVTAGHTH